MTIVKSIIEATTRKPVCCYADPDVKEWRNSDKKLHREDGPAVEYATGQKEWWINGERHREDGPAVLHANGSKSWYRNNERHRDDGPAIEYSNGVASRWYNHGVLHRVGGPAVDDVNGRSEWWFQGRPHRTDGPAIVVTGGPEEYFVNGRRFTEEEFYKYVDPETGEVFLPPGKKLTYDDL